MKELSTRIHTVEERQHIYVDQYDEGVWLSVNIRGASVHVTLSKDQAKDMIAALIAIVDAKVEA